MATATRTATTGSTVAPTIAREYRRLRAAAPCMVSRRCNGSDSSSTCAPVASITSRGAGGTSCDLLDSLPAGLDTRVGERGTSLSGGQRQRVALARAVIRQPQLLVLDDATSAVDPAVEQQILAALRQASSGTTVLVVAYRMATITLADDIVYLEEGRVVDHGTHDELLGRCDGYQRLVTAYAREAAERAAVAADEERATVGADR